jgi:hypothetical protein
MLKTDFPSGWQIRPLTSRMPKGGAQRMPRIPDQIRECVVYIYPDEESADEGSRAGGSGFVVGVQSKSLHERHFVYVVTNRHAIRNCKNPVIRFNTKQGGLGILTTGNEDWQFHDNCDDLAAISIDLRAPYTYQFLPESLFLTKELVEQYDIGPGDDVFFVGRFVDHEGKQKNWPALRFGHISMMPWEPIPQEGSGILQESFVVEGRSIGGFSGSPVFVSIPPLTERPGMGTLELVRYGPWLMGIDWGHLNVCEAVLDAVGKPHPDKLFVKANSGMSCVVPAWKLRELLDQEAFVKERERIDERLAREATSAATLDTPSKV